MNKPQNLVTAKTGVYVLFPWCNYKP